MIKTEILYLCIELPCSVSCRLTGVTQKRLNKSRRYRKKGDYNEKPVWRVKK